MALFAEVSIVGNQRAWLAKAATEVQAIDRVQMLSPNLAGRIEEIATKYSLGDAPVLKPDGIQGERRDVERPINDFGMRRVIRVPVLDVFIPFDGDGQWLRFQPSRCTLIDLPVEIRGQSLVITLRDEPPEQQRQQIERFVSMVKGNVDVLSQDVDAFRRQLRQMLDDAVKQRVQQINAERERDSKLGFPIS
jgi:hypothetical protein